MSDVVWDFKVGSESGYEALMVAIETQAIVAASPTAFLLQDGDASALFLGSFTLNGAVITGGTITGFKVFVGTTKVLEATGHSIDVNAFQVGLANNAFAVYALLLGSPMTVNGSEQDDGLAGSRFADVAGVDHLYGNGGDDAISGFEGDDFIFGGDGFDEIDGGTGNDFLSGGNGNDELDGDDGSDAADYLEKLDAIAVTLNGPNDAVVLVGGFAEDTIRNVENVNGAAGNDVLVGDTLANRFVGNGGDDKLFGNDGNDALLGEAGRDKIRGGNGNDEIHGGDGNDILTGGADSDIFFFDTKPGANNVDKLKDFSHAADTIAFEHDIFAKLDLGKLKAKFFAVGDEASDGDDHVIYNDATGALYYDRDGTGAAHQVQLARLHAGLNLAADDFLVV